MDDRSSGTRPWTVSRLWLWWVVATAAGTVLAFAAFVALFSMIGEPAHPAVPLIMAGFGLATGLFQQRVLRRALGEARCWPQATGVGLGVGAALAGAAGLGDTPGLVAQIAPGAVAGAAGGAVIGTLQWVVLTTQVCDARWWVVASVAGWATGAAVSDGVAYYAGGLDLVISPVVAASVTGIAVSALLRSQNSDANAPRIGGSGCRHSASSRPVSSPAPHSGPDTQSHGRRRGHLPGARGSPAARSAESHEPGRDPDGAVVGP